MKFSQYLYEGIRAADFERAVGTIVKYLEKHVGTMYKYPEVEHYSGSNGKGIGLRYFLQDGTSLRFNWTSTAASSKLDSISLWDGSTKYPNFNIRGIGDVPLGQLSLVKILPTLVQVIKNPVAGEVELSTQESKSVYAELDKMLLENVLKEDAYDDVVDAIEQGPVSSYTFSKMGRNQERIFKEILATYKDDFDTKVDGAGRQRYTLVSTPAEFDRETIVGAVLGNQAKRARLGVLVSAGGSEDVTTDGELSAQKQHPSAPARIPYEEQLEDLKTIITAVVKGASNFAVITGGGGLGKALPNRYPVLTPTGWVRIDDLDVCDEVVAQDGTVANVTGVYPQGKLRTMVITFSDGREVECSPDHLWEVSINGKKGEVFDTQELKKYVDGEIVRLDRRVTIPLFIPPAIADVKLPIDPYLLGALLGDGGFTNGRNLTFSNIDEDIINYVSNSLTEGFVLRKKVGDNCDYNIRMVTPKMNGHVYITALENLGLFGKYSHEKFIPSQYKNASTPQKLALLQGLMDTDGTVEKGGSLIFSSSSLQLVQDVQELVFSIGGKGRISSRPSSYTKNGVKVDCLPTHSILIQYHTPSDLIKCTRKLARITDQPQYSNVQLAITGIEWTGNIEECTCIAIDHPRKLYVTKDYVPTHNTHTVEKTLQSLGLEDGNGYFLNTTSGSAAGLYKTLFMNKKGIVVLDDCDTIAATQEGRNLLKAALDTKKKRKLVWSKASSWTFDPANEEEMVKAEDAIAVGEEPELFPKYYDYEGRVIMISNLAVESLDPDGALATRGFMLTLNPTKDEVFAFMRKIVDTIPVEGSRQLTLAEKLAVVDLIEQQGGTANIRKLVRGLNMASSGVPNFERIIARYC